MTDKNRFDLHLRKPVGNKTPQELFPLDIDRLRRQVAKSHSIATTRNVLELLRRITNFGARQRHCAAHDWTIELPKQDPNSEYFEILSPEQFRQLQYGNLIQTAKFSFYISLLVGRVQGPQKYLNCTGRMLIVSGKLHPA